MHPPRQPRCRGSRPRVGVGNPDSRSDGSRYDRPMLFLLYLVVRALVRLLVSAGQPGRADGSKDLEILVLRHQLRVLQRTSGAPKRESTRGGCCVDRRLVGLPRHPGDLPPVASRAREEEVDLPQDPSTWPATDRCRDP